MLGEVLKARNGGGRCDCRDGGDFRGSRCEGGERVRGDERMV